MSSGATSINRKRTHSLEQGGERVGSDINAKKPRVSSEAPPKGKKRRGKKKRTAPVVDDIAGPSSTRSHDGGAEPMSLELQRRGGHRGKSRRAVESDEEDISTIPGPTPHPWTASKSRASIASTSSSPSLKGKEWEVEPVPIVKTSSAEDLSKETEALSQKLDLQTTKLTLHSTLISSFKDSLTCQICVDLMYKPFTLAPCGHIACYSCLVGWFKSNVPEDEFAPEPVHRKKTCPHCRSTVRDRPIENFVIKEMVHSLVNSGVLEDVPGDLNAMGAMPAASADPWAGIFLKYPVMENNFDGLPFPMFDDDDDHDLEEGDLAIYDEEDDVYRCRGCMNEVVDGFCTLCEREYQQEWGVPPLLGGLFGGYGDALWGDDDSEEEGFEEEYEGSFIDDVEGVGNGPDSDLDVAPVPLFDMEDEDDEEDEVTEVEPLPVVRHRPRQASTIVISSDEEGDYTDADAYGDHDRSRDEHRGFHDAHSDSDGQTENEYWPGSDGDPDDDDRGFYGYL